MIEQRPTLLLASAKWWPLAARLAIALRDHGCDVVGLCPERHPLGRISGLRAVHRYDGVDSLGSLARAMRESGAGWVVPCDDGVVAQLHMLHAQDESLRACIERSLGPPQSYPIVRSRDRLLSLAGELGVRVPRMQAVHSEADLIAWHQSHSRAVVKVDGENGGNGVRVCATEAESIEALRRLRTPPNLLTAIKRLEIDGDPLAMWRLKSRPVAGVTVQEFIEGRPANCMFACRDGAVLGVVSVAVVVSEGPTGAATVVRIIRSAAMESAARRIAERLRLSGFYGLDYIIEHGSGISWLIEMNPRCTQLGHLELPGVGSLAGAFAASLRGVAPKLHGDPIRCETIALFPQAQAGGAACRAYIDAGHHDVPAGEPELLHDLLHGAWPLRRWPARLYHAFNRVEKSAATLYEPAGLTGPGKAPPPADETFQAELEGG